MRKTVLLLTFFLSFQLFAHRVLLMVDDNGDGTVYIETGLSSGGSAAGAKVYITERATGRPLWQGVIPEEGHMNVKRPNVPYSVSLKMGNGHTVTQKGPELLPIKEEGTEKETTEASTEDAPKSDEK